MSATSARKASWGNFGLPGGCLMAAVFLLVIGPNPATGMAFVVDPVRAGHGWRGRLSALADQLQAADPSALFLGVLAALAWLLLARILLAFLLETLAACLTSGGAGQLALRRAARAVSPRFARGAITVVAGVSISAGVTAPAFAAPFQPAPTVAPAATQLERWPDLAQAGRDVPVPTPRPTTSGAHTSPAPTSPAARSSAAVRSDLATVRVAAGDCLWTLARQALPPDASDSQVASATAGWWQQNRAVIGADPDVLQVGQVLTAPGG
jgi:hypothetical protein